MDRRRRLARAIASLALVAGTVRIAATDALAVVPESLEARAGGTPVDSGWLDRA